MTSSPAKALAAALLVAFAPVPGTAAVGPDARPARGATPAAKARSASEITREAKAHFARGTTLYKQARYREAIAEFEAAYRLRPHGVLFYNLAQCYERLGDIPAALRAYHDYLRAVPDADDRATVRQAMSSLEARLGATGVQQLLVYSDPPGADVQIDGQPRGRTPFSVVLPHGAHAVTVVKPGFAPVHRDAVLSPGVSLELDLRLTPAGAAGSPGTSPRAGGEPGAPATAPAPKLLPPPLTPAPAEAVPGLSGAAQAEPATIPTAKPRVWTWVAAGVAVAALAGGIAYGVAAKNASNDLRNGQGGNPWPQATAQQLADSASARSRNANILYGVAGAAGAAGVGLFFFEGHF